MSNTKRQCGSKLLLVLQVGLSQELLIFLTEGRGGEVIGAVINAFRDAAFWTKKAIQKTARAIEDGIFYMGKDVARWAAAVGISLCGLDVDELCARGKGVNMYGGRNVVAFSNKCPKKAKIAQPEPDFCVIDAVCEFFVTCFTRKEC